jgi:uncharacterized secreted protein with C-terminal beta-propeller domain
VAENLSRRLRMVRPRTHADDDWTATSQADEMLTEIHRRIDHLSAARPERRRGVTTRGLLIRTGTVAAAAAAVVVATSLADSAGGPRAGHPVVPSAVRPAAMMLHPFASCDDLLSGLRSHAATHVGLYGVSYGYGGPSYGLPYPVPMHAAVPADGTGPAAAPGVAPGEGTSGGTSTTNVQEPGVDEPDIVKTDGNDVVTLTDGVLRVVDKASQAVVGTLDLTEYEGWQGAQLLVGDGHAVVILNPVPGYPYPDYWRPYTFGQRSTYLFVDLGGQPTVTGSLRASGSYVDARQVGSTIRIVVRSAPDIHLPIGLTHGVHTRSGRIDANREAIRGVPLSSWLPRYSMTDGGRTATASVACDRVSHPVHYTGRSMLSIYTLDLDHLGTSPDPVSIAADGDTVYATSTSLYVASSPQWYCCGGHMQQRTQLHRFDISGTGAPTYLGSASLPGRLLNHYSMSEYQGELRVATTTNRRASGEASSVYVLDAATLKTIGHVDDLGPDEQIYAVRFIGPMAYVVTFQQFDPLYVVDLRDPVHPKVAGTLDLTGFSAYLHDAGGGRLIGVGQEIAGNEPSGMQVSLFDVTTPSKPTRVGQVVVPRASGGQPGFDPHTFLYWDATGLVVVPMHAWTRGESGRVLVLRVSGLHLAKLGTVANPRTAGSTGDRRGIQRAMIVDDRLWTISGSGIRVSDQSTLSSEGSIPFPAP